MWQIGESITAEKMNALEDRVQNAYQAANNAVNALIPQQDLERLVARTNSLVENVNSILTSYTGTFSPIVLYSTSNTPASDTLQIAGTLNEGSIAILLVKSGTLGTQNIQIQDSNKTFFLYDGASQPFSVKLPANFILEVYITKIGNTNVAYPLNLPLAL